MKAEMRCPNCGEPDGRHFAPPSLGEPGFYTCDPVTSLGVPAASVPPEPPTLSAAPTTCGICGSATGNPSHGNCTPTYCRATQATVRAYVAALRAEVQRLKSETGRARSEESDTNG